MFKTQFLLVLLSFGVVLPLVNFARMLQHTQVKNILLFFCFLIAHVNLKAGGFQINMLGMKATSMAGVFTGVGNDASSVFHNPGAMTFQEYSQISAGAAFSLPSTSYLSPFTGNNNMQNQFFAPLHLYAVGILNEKMAVGLSVNSPYHERSKWDANWPGKYIVIQTNTRATYVQPTFSYKAGETFGIGAGPVIAFGKTFLSKALPIANSSGDVVMELDGNSVGFGFNIGVYFKPNDEFSAGLNYRSAVKMNVKDGDASFSNVPVSLLSSIPSNTSFETSYSLPSVITGGISFMLTRELMVCADINYTMWNVFDSLQYEFKDYSELNFGNGKFYKNAFAIRIGSQYKLSNKINLRAGVAFDKSPVPKEYLSPENPDNDRFMFSLGGSVKFGERFSADAAFMLQNIKEQETRNIETNFGGNYKSLINIFGLTLNYHFVR